MLPPSAVHKKKSPVTGTGPRNHRRSGRSPEDSKVNETNSNQAQYSTEDAGFQDAPEDAPENTRAANWEVPPQFDTGSDVELAQELHLKLRRTYGEIVFCESKFWHYGETHWIELAGTELWRMAFEYNGARYGGKGAKIKLAAGRVESVIKCLEKLCDQPGFFSSASRGVNCLSGFVDYDATGEPRLLPHLDSHRQRDTLPGHWDPARRIKQVPEDTLIHTLLYGSTAGDPEQADKIEALLRLAGAVVTGSGTRGVDPKAVILKGESKAGKGQILTMFRGLVPAGAQCSISPSQFADKNFVVELAGKLLNTYDELGSTYAVTSEVFKQVITGDPVTGCRKYGHPFAFPSRAQNIFACNLLPAFRGGVDKAVLNRLYIIQFDRAIEKDDRVEHLGARIVAEEMDLLLGLAIEGASRLIRAGGFPHLASSEAELEELAETDSVVLWFKDQITRTQLEKVNTDGTRTPMRLTTNEMYASYKSWSETNGHDRKSIVHVNVFSQRLRSQGLKRMNAHGFRGFVGVQFNFAKREHREAS